VAPPPISAQLAEGARVKVKAPVKVFHVGKYKEGLDLEGLEGTIVQANVGDYKHHDGKQHTLSATLPVKVQFMVPAPDGGKDVKVLVHLVSIAGCSRGDVWQPGCARGYTSRAAGVGECCGNLFLWSTNGHLSPHCCLCAATCRRTMKWRRPELTTLALGLH
jgi:hypothetical protein